MTIDPGLQPLVELALADLTARTGADRDDVTVVSAELVTWPDRGFLGPAHMVHLTEVPVDGSEIVLKANGRTFRYRTGGSVHIPVLYSPYG